MLPIRATVRGMQTASLPDLTSRAREVFAALVDTYLASGEPVGSRTLARRLPSRLSPATVRNVMQDLEEMGLLTSPHPSAGRVPSQPGLRLYVDAMLEVSDLVDDDSRKITAELAEEPQPSERVFARATRVLSGLSHGASLVLAPTYDNPVRHVELLSIAGGSILVMLVMENGHVENRLFDAPPGFTLASLREAANFLNAHLQGQSLAVAQREVAKAIEHDRQLIDTVSKRLVEKGMASLEGADHGTPDRMIVRGRSNLIEGALDHEYTDRLRELFDDLERRQTVAQLLDLVREARGVRVYIGSENPLFSLSGSSLVISPYMNGKQQVIGALGVIGPTSINYGRVVPAVDFTARLVGRLLEPVREDVAEDFRFTEDE